MDLAWIEVMEKTLKKNEINLRLVPKNLYLVFCFFIFVSIYMYIL